MKSPCLLAGLCLSPLTALAQTAPTAGQLLQQAMPAARAPQTQAPETRVEEARAATAAGSETIAVHGIRFSGNTVFAETSLQALVAGDIAPRMSIAALDALAARVKRYYRDQGYLVAQAWLPPQDISAGVITIAVLEGRIGQVQLDNKAALAATATAPITRMRVGDAVNTDRLEGPLLQLADLPGVQVRSTLRPGESLGASDVLVELLPDRAVTGSYDIDNFGNRYAGEYRLGASMFWNNPASLGDQASLRLQAGTHDYRYGRVGYQLPLGAYATRVGAAVSGMHYTLGKAFAPLDAHGSATVGSLYVQQPLRRGRTANWFATLQYDSKRLNDAIDATRTSSRKTAHETSLGVYGNFIDALGGSASNSLAINYVRGRLGMDPASRQADQLTARSSGTFGKWTADYQRLQRLPGNWMLKLGANGQWTHGNLDSSEKLSLGGATGVRAYPQGEATGDSGYMASLELHHPFATQWDAFGFYDDGRVRINRRPWSPTDNNHRHIAGYGAGVSWVRGPFSAQAFAAWKAGTGAPQSDTDRHPRVWMQAVLAL